MLHEALSALRGKEAELQKGPQPLRDGNTELGRTVFVLRIVSGWSLDLALRLRSRRVRTVQSDSRSLGWKREALGLLLPSVRKSKS